MKIVCDKNILTQAVTNVSRAVSAKTINPALEGILLKTENNQLTLIAYDLEISIITTIDVTVQVDGSIILSSKLFVDMVRKMPQNQISIEVDDKYLTTISSGKTEFNILGINPADFPELPKISELQELQSFFVESKTLQNMITQTHFALATSELKPVHTGSMFDLNNGTFNIISLDGFRLALRTEPIENEENYSFIVPGKTLSEISKLITPNQDEEKSSPVKMTLSKKHISFEVERYTIISRLLEGEFIDYQKSIPQICNTKITVNVRELTAAIERASLLINDKIKQPLKITFTDNKMKIFCQTTIGRCYEELSCKIEGNDLETGFNHRYLLDALKNCGCDEIIFEINNSLSPMKVVPPIENPPFTFLVLPVRMKSE